MKYELGSQMAFKMKSSFCTATRKNSKYYLEKTFTFWTFQETYYVDEEYLKFKEWNLYKWINTIKTSLTHETIARVRYPSSNMSLLGYRMPCPPRHPSFLLIFTFAGEIFLSNTTNLAEKLYSNWPWQQATQGLNFYIYFPYDLNALHPTSNTHSLSLSEAGLQWERRQRKERRLPYKMER